MGLVVTMLRCPRCGRQGARRSRRVGVRDHLLSVVGLYPFRCQLCATRFRAFQGRHHSEHGGERREYDRLFVRVPVRISGGGTSDEGETVDLSLTGCSVRTDAAYEPGATVELRLGLGQAGDVEVQSAVVRTQREGGLGLQFERMAAPERERLSLYLGRFQRPSGAPPRRAARPRPELVLVAAVGIGVIVLVLLLIGRLGAPPVR